MSVDISKGAVERLATEIEIHEDCPNVISATLRALSQALSESDAALSKYGEHTNECASNYASYIGGNAQEVKCICGFDAVRASRKGQRRVR